MRARVERWWVGVVALLVLCAGATAVAQVSWRHWPQRPLGMDRGARGVVEHLGSERGGFDRSCSTNEEVVESRIDDHHWARVATIDGEPFHACWREGTFGIRGRLIDGYGNEVRDGKLLARAGVVPGNDGRTRLGLLVWGLLLPLLTIAWTYVWQRVLVTSRFFRLTSWIGVFVLWAAYFYAVVTSITLYDGPGALAAVVGAFTTVAVLLLGRLTIGHVSRALQAGGAAAQPPRDSSLATLLEERDEARGRRDEQAVDAAPTPVPAPVDVNSASEEQVAALPGVGPVRARRIVERREQEGRIGDFEAFCEIVEPTRRVREQLEDRIEFGPGGTARRTTNPEHDDPDDPYGGRRVDV